MARPIAELEKDIRELDSADRERLLDALISGLEDSDADLETLARDLKTAVEKSTKALDAAIARLDCLDAELEQGRIEVREQVLRSAERWPFRLPASFDPSR
jgi:hypothetical protein